MEVEEKNEACSLIVGAANISKDDRSYLPGLSIKSEADWIENEQIDKIEEILIACMESSCSNTRPELLLNEILKDDEALQLVLMEIKHIEINLKR